MTEAQALKEELKQDYFANTPTIRDYFATSALEGLLSNAALTIGTCEIVGTVLAQVAYKYADAMLEVRKNERA